MRRLDAWQGGVEGNEPMARKVIGPTGSRRRRWLFLCTSAAAIAVAVLIIPSAFAVHDTGAFELDGNATAATTDDWDRACYQVAVNGGATAAAATAQCGASQGLGAANTGAAWVNDGALNATIFTGGGSKDPSDISSWAWKTDTGGLPDKDNLLHAYASEYSLTGTNKDGTCPNGTDLPAPIGTGTFDGSVNCRVLFFGSDRFDNSGDAQQGFWFFQNKVGTKTGGSFNGVHKNGDVLVISDFSNGGTTSTITVYSWDSTCKKAASNSPSPGQCGDTNLRLLSTSTSALCGGSLAQNDNACGIVNSRTITMPWSFTDKSGTAGNGALNGEFFEAGINLSTLGLAGECFSSVASETRSSTSTTATLKDFVLGGFEKCTPALTTQVKNGSGTNTNGTIQPGTAVHDTAKVTVTGAQSPADATGTVDFFLCGPNATQAPDCSTGGTQIGGDVNLTDTSNPANASDGISGGSSADVNGTGHELGNGYYCFRAEAHLTNYDSPTGYTDSTSECFQVLKITTQTHTTPQQSGSNITGNVTFGTTASVTDHAVITADTSGGGDINGSVTFTICDPTVLAANSETTCATGGTTVGSAVPVSPTSGADPPSSTADSSAIAPNKLGKWCWKAVFTPTGSVYGGSSDSTSGECFTVVDTAGLTSGQTWIPNDSATVQSTNGAPLNGTLTITLYSTSDCSGTAVANQSYSTNVDSSVTAHTSATVSSSNTASGYVVSGNGTHTVSWKVHFASSDSNVTVTNQDACESTSMTITN